jgi:O-antigen ligase
MDGSLPASLEKRPRLVGIADGLVVAVAASLPWSTSATGILIVLWLVALVPTLDLPAIKRELVSPAGGLPVLFCALGFVGMSWGDASLSERLGGATPFVRFLAIPLLFAQFRRSEIGRWVFAGFLASSVVLLALSFVKVATLAYLPWPKNNPGVPVKDYLSQSTIFGICLLGLAYVVIDASRMGRRATALSLLILASGFLANILYIVTSRTELLVLLIVLTLLCLRQFDWKRLVGAAIVGTLVAGIAWSSSPYLRNRVLGIFDEIRLYRAEDAVTSAGIRIEYWKKSLGFVAQAPIFGNGTGSIDELFRRSVVGTSGASASASHNPHQQTLAVAIQLGLVGVALLFSIWIAHLMLFYRPGLTSWIGFVIVMQNIVSSLFNSHLFDFTHSWIYVFGVGVTGGMVRAASSPSAQTDLPWQHDRLGSPQRGADPAELAG